MVVTGLVVTGVVVAGVSPHVTPSVFSVCGVDETQAGPLNSGDSAVETCRNLETRGGERRV